MIRKCGTADYETIEKIVNDGARAYQGIIPDDCWVEPYMPREELETEIENGVEFWGVEETGALSGVMGMQRVRDVTLIRHAYVRTNLQNRGIGSSLLRHLQALAQGPMLIGTWADALWAIRFYEKHGFILVEPPQKQRLLDRYWNVSSRQSEVSVVLANAAWRDGFSE